MIWPLKKKNKKFTANGADAGNSEELEILINHCRANLKSCDENLVRKAFFWCKEAYKGKTLLSGEPYYTAPLATAGIVANEMPLDDISVACALISGIPSKSGRYSSEDIRMEFGKTIAEIVEGIEKIQLVEKREFANVDNYRKLLLSLFKDVRIILVKLADRLQNLRTLGYLPTEKQIKFANEAMEIYAPFAHRFGLANIKWEIEDLSFQYLEAETYSDIIRRLELNREERERYVDEFARPIVEKFNKLKYFKENDIKFDISGRPKHVYSIVNKMKTRGIPFEELYDLYAIRIILDTDEEGYCMIAYSKICEIYKPIPRLFKDYIHNPKKNGYQSIHFAVSGPDGRVVEIQIRTRKMHEIAEMGLAAHFNYKRGFLPAKSVLDDEGLDDWMSLVRNIFEHIGAFENPQQLIESVKNNLFQGEIFIFTPKNDIKIFPKGATPLDFAYQIHTEVGNSCVGAKVNGKIFPLDYKLESGDQIEIITSNKQKPVENWLDCAATNKARNAILKYLKNEEKRDIEKGRKKWRYLLSEFGADDEGPALDSVMNRMNYKTHATFFTDIAKGEIKLSDLFDSVKAFRNMNGGLDERKHEILQNIEPSLKANGIIRQVNGHKLKYALSECCCPIPGDTISGEIGESNSTIKIHRASCPKVKENNDSAGVFNLEWPEIDAKGYKAKIKIISDSNPEIIGRINQAITNQGAVINTFSLNAEGDRFAGLASFTLAAPENLASLIESIQKIEGVKSVERAMAD